MSKANLLTLPTPQHSSRQIDLQKQKFLKETEIILKKPPSALVGEVPRMLNLILVRLHKSKEVISKDDDDLQKCCYTLKNTVSFDSCPEEIRDTPFESFLNRAEIANFGIDKWKEYVKMKLNEEKYICGMEQRYSDGLAEGKAEANRVTAKNLLAAGIEPELVANCTGLSMDVIKAL